MNFKKYMNIGAVVGSAITVERLIRKRDELFDEPEAKDGWWVLGAVMGAHWGNLINVVLWPVSLVQEICELTSKK